MSLFRVAYSLQAQPRKAASATLSGKNADLSAITTCSNSPGVLNWDNDIWTSGLDKHNIRSNAGFNKMMGFLGNSFISFGFILLENKSDHDTRLSLRTKAQLKGK